MTKEQVQAAVGAYLRGEFGKLLVVREVRRVHHVNSMGWKVHIVAPSREGDIHIADLEVDEKGVLSPLLDPLGVVDVLRASDEPIPAEARDSLILDDGPPSLVVPDLEQRIREHLDKGDLERARSLYPRMLKDPDQRASTLLEMASLERRLGNAQIAIGYLEAAAREFADRFDVEGLEDAAALGLDLLGDEAFETSQVHSLLERSRARLKPLMQVTDAPALAGAVESEREWLDINAEVKTLKRGEFLVREGEPSRAVWIIKSGILAVMLEKPDGTSRVIRCCFPGYLLGESSVLVDGDPRCTASLRAERMTAVYKIDAALLKTVMEKNAALRERIKLDKQLHRIDSFFAMHETMGQLDALVRDEMLACLQRIQSFEEDTLLFPAGEVPAAACLVARGELSFHEGWELDSPPAMVVPTDHFANVRDAIHGIQSPFTTLARAGSTIAFFDAKKLRKLAEQSPPHVSAVLERLG
jgi:CRP-like cAMP-binding protein